jgi:hypothetical protein
MLVKLSTNKTVSETAAALQAAVQANHFDEEGCGVRPRMPDLRGLSAATSEATIDSFDQWGVELGKVLAQRIVRRSASQRNTASPIASPPHPGISSPPAQADAVNFSMKSSLQRFANVIERELDAR